MKFLKYTLCLLLFSLWAATGFAQADPAGWFTVETIAPSTVYAAAPSVSLPIGTVYRFWGTSAAGVTTYCDSQTATATAPISGWVFSCTVQGSTVADYSYNGNHSMEVQEAGSPITCTLIVPGQAQQSLTVPALTGAAPVPPIASGATPSILISQAGTGYVITLTNFNFIPGVTTNTSWAFTCQAPVAATAGTVAGASVPMTTIPVSVPVEDVTRATVQARSRACVNKLGCTKKGN